MLLVVGTPSYRASQTLCYHHSSKQCPHQAFGQAGVLRGQTRINTRSNISPHVSLAIASTLTSVCSSCAKDIACSSSPDTDWSCSSRWFWTAVIPRMSSVWSDCAFSDAFHLSSCSLHGLQQSTPNHPMHQCLARTISTISQAGLTHLIHRVKLLYSSSAPRSLHWSSPLSVCKHVAIQILLNSSRSQFMAIFAPVVLGLRLLDARARSQLHCTWRTACAPQVRLLLGIRRPCFSAAPQCR